MEPAKTHEYHLPAGMFGGKRVLRLSPDMLAYGRGNAGQELYAKVRKDEIADIRHSVQWIIWYRFYVGCKFKIDVKTTDGNIIRVRFSVYFGKISRYQDVYEEIINQIWNYYLNDLEAAHLQRFYAGKTLSFNGVHLQLAGVMLGSETAVINWEDVKLKTYENYFVIYKASDPEQHKIIEFEAWECEILLGILETLVQKHN